MFYHVAVCSRRPAVLQSSFCISGIKAISSVITSALFIEQRMRRSRDFPVSPLSSRYLKWIWNFFNVHQMSDWVQLEFSHLVNVLLFDGQDLRMYCIDRPRVPETNVLCNTSLNIFLFQFFQSVNVFLFCSRRIYSAFRRSQVEPIIQQGFCAFCPFANRIAII